jgi:GH15 family glucan-1,4-alpha-glucosidase
LALTADATVFGPVLKCTKDLDLHAEKFDVRGDPLGNFPQAFTHLALMRAVYYLDLRNDQEWRP